MLRARTSTLLNPVLYAMVSPVIAETLREYAPGTAVLASLERFVENDVYLLRVDANERSMTHRFGMYLQAELPDWDVDCEYNRDHHTPKELFLKARGNEEGYDEHARTVFPDVIVHHRGTKENYLVIEFKKTSSSIDDDDDYAKLVEFRCQLDYEHALFIKFQTVDDPFGIHSVEWVGA